MRVAFHVRSARWLTLPLAGLLLFAGLVTFSNAASATVSATVSPTSLAFGSVQVDDSSAKNVTLTVSKGYDLDDTNSVNGTSITGLLQFRLTLVFRDQAAA